MSKNHIKPSRPKWLKDSGAAPCPPWARCFGDHAADEHPVDRTHISSWEFAFRPSLMEPEVYRKRDDGSGLFDHSPWNIEVYVEQLWRDREPHIAIAPDLTNGPLGKGLQVTVDEAIKLRAALGKAIKLARGGER